MNDVQKLKSRDGKKFSSRERHCKSFRNKRRTISSRLTGKTEFSYKEAKRIKDTFFPNVELEYLFEEVM